MDPQARDIVQNTLTSYCAPRTRQDGGYNGDAPPDDLAEFTARVKEPLSSFKANSWELDSIEMGVLITMANAAYENTWDCWKAKPLNTDAPQSVVDWHAA